MEISIKRDENIIASKSGEVEAYLVFNEEFIPGDAIVLRNLEKGHYLIDLGLGRAIVYSNGKDFVFPIPFNEKRDGRQEFVFSPKIVSSLTICNLIKSDDPSPFPALIQAEVYGKERVWK